MHILVKTPSCGVAKVVKHTTFLVVPSDGFVVPHTSMFQCDTILFVFFKANPKSGFLNSQPSHHRHYLVPSLVGK